MKKLDLKDRTVLITGASSGIGAASARVFYEQGCKLVLLARRMERLEELRAELGDSGARIHCAEVDVRYVDQLKTFFAAIPDSFSHIDLLLNNAGLAAGVSKLHEGDIDDWERMIDTNIKGLLYISRLVVPGMVERNRGQVINIGSVAGREPYPGGSVYCGTKAAVRFISRSLKMDLQGTSVRVSNIEPGAVETEFSNVRYHGDQAKADKVYQGINPLTAEDIADTILYCASTPEHVNVAELLVLANAQASAYHVHRNTD
jgi:serine 3-dehydrogenase